MIHDETATTGDVIRFDDPGSHWIISSAAPVVCRTSNTTGYNFRNVLSSRDKDVGTGWKFLWHDREWTRYGFEWDKNDVVVPDIKAWDYISRCAPTSPSCPLGRFTKAVVRGVARIHAKIQFYRFSTREIDQTVTFRFGLDLQPTDLELSRKSLEGSANTALLPIGSGSIRIQVPANAMWTDYPPAQFPDAIIEQSRTLFLEADVSEFLKRWNLSTHIMGFLAGSTPAHAWSEVRWDASGDARDPSIWSLGPDFECDSSLSLGLWGTIWEPPLPHGWQQKETCRSNDGYTPWGPFWLK
jgi:hypothetical protein